MPNLRVRERLAAPEDSLSLQDPPASPSQHTDQAARNGQLNEGDRLLLSLKRNKMEWCDIKSTMENTFRQKYNVESLKRRHRRANEKIKDQQRKRPKHADCRSNCEDTVKKIRNAFENLEFFEVPPINISLFSPEYQEICKTKLKSPYGWFCRFVACLVHKATGEENLELGVMIDDEPLLRSLDFINVIVDEVFLYSEHLARLIYSCLASMNLSFATLAKKYSHETKHCMAVDVAKGLVEQAITPSASQLPQFDPIEIVSQITQMRYPEVSKVLGFKHMARSEAFQRIPINISGEKPQQDQEGNQVSHLPASGETQSDWRIQDDMLPSYVSPVYGNDEEIFSLIGPWTGMD